MNKVAAYQLALARIEAEKTAEAIIENYGTSEGYMPGPYLLAFDQMEKDAWLAAGVKSVRGGLMRAGERIAKGAGGAATASHIPTRVGTHFRAADNAGLGNSLKVLGGNALQAVAQNPRKTLAAGAVGVGAAGLGVKKILS